MQTIDDIKADFKFLESDDFSDRYSYVMELGRQMPPMPPGTQSDCNKVHGCVSQLWIHSELTSDEPKKMRLYGTSDSEIVKGLAAIAIAMLNELTPEEILEFDAEGIFISLGLRDQLTSKRAGGVRAILERIRGDAKSAIQIAQ